MAEPVTEGANERSNDLDRMSARAIVALMTDEDARVLEAVRSAGDAIARAVDEIAERLERGGRLFYVGAGTSGRLGVLDASECPPTFGTDPATVVGVIAGGSAALREAVEGAEDDEVAGARDMAALGLSDRDTVVGISASGAAPYVIEAVRIAADSGAFTVAITCNEGSELASAAACPIEVVVGPEVLGGSTRLKAGTATKLVLNMLSTAAMVRLGKCYRNLMVDLQASNKKLERRARRIVGTATGLDPATVEGLLARCDGDVKVAIVAGRADVSPPEARARLAAAKGRVRAALDE